MKLIEVSHEKCVGCRLCEMVCSLFHEGECSTTRSRIKIIRDEEFGNNLVSMCIQCAEEYCVQSCPEGALNRNPQTGAVVLDEKSCKGCEACVVVCPTRGITFDKERDIVLKCDLCGGDPQCVQFCSREALILKETEIAAPERKTFQLETKKLLSQV
ncbi:MAG: 4Fe-4S dicluster domain-containing protein [Chloroflexi bacterium]|nr:4Fe-4S dicluster domain-containing protein [Chloroflexota bacterium]